VSYTIRLIGQKCETCGLVPEEPDLPDPTYNLAPIFAAVFPKQNDTAGLYGLSGKKASDTCEMLTLALERLSDPACEKSFRALEPLNGWDTLETAIEVIFELKNAAHQYPNHTWEIS